MNFKETLSLISQDLDHYRRGAGALAKLATALFSVGFRTLASHRIQHYLHVSGIRIPGLKAWLQYRMQTRCGCHISPAAKIGRRLRLSHPTGVVIGAGVEIGDDVTIYQHVTLGSHGDPLEDKAYPRVGNRVTIFANAIIVGGVDIGDDSVIAAAAFVNKHVPRRDLAAGRPATTAPRRRRELLCEAK